MYRVAISAVVGIAISLGIRTYLVGPGRDVDQVDQILRDMRRSQENFNPKKLNDLGVDGAGALLARLMQETKGQIGYAGYFVFRSGYVPAFKVFVAQVEDVERRKILAQEAVKGFAAGRPYGDRRALLGVVVHVVVQSRNDELIDLLQPLLTHKDRSVSEMLMNEVRLVRQDDSRYYPTIYFAALSSDNPHIVDEALNWAPNCWDEAKRPKLRDALQGVFQGENEELKFQSCFPLMHEFHDASALAYLADQAGSADSERAHRAITWLGDTCNNRRPPSPDVLAALTAHLHSPDQNMRRDAVDAIGNYPGREILEIIVPLLADPDPQIVKVVQWNLQLRLDPRNRDFAVLRELLTNQLKTTTDPKLQSQTQELLDKMAAQERVPPK